LVVNESATVPASLPAESHQGRFVVNLCTPFGRGLWLVEPRRSIREPGAPVGLDRRRWIVGDVPVEPISTHPGLPRLWFVRAQSSLERAMERRGSPIRYGYVTRRWPLSAYQTVFGRVPGSCEMPSAGRPFSERVVRALGDRGVAVAPILLHCGVSSLEVESEAVEAQPLYPEPFEVSVATASRVNTARAEGHRVIAVGTTVVRALESAWDGTQVRPARGHTRLYVHPGQPPHVVDGLITGFHDPLTSHLALLYALLPEERVRAAYSIAVDRGYLWHEFGDSHLLLR
jgi:S-adenosylmethionine:tRNA ribosyltransferase-isomerase